jgi:inhibitor of cysteine peptidase
MGRSLRALGSTALGLALAMSLAACTPRSAGPLQLTLKDSGSTQTMSAGQELRITLDSNVTTGYRWALEGELPHQLEQVGEPEYSTESTAIGAGGTEVWTFVTASPGDGTLRLKYARSFEPTATPPQKFEVGVKVE